MKKDNYSFSLIDDHNGNKALVINKGHLNIKNITPNNVFYINDPKFEPIANKLCRLIDEIEIKDSDHSCN